MEIIISENQNSLLRRYSTIKNEVYNRMDGSDPCYYSSYHDFDRYKRDVLNAAIDQVIEEDGLDIDTRVWADFRNKLLYDLNDIIKDFYYDFISEKCPRW
jgi:hypothetical protein